MYTTIRHEIRHASKVWPGGTLVDPCLLSGWEHEKERNTHTVTMALRPCGTNIKVKLGTVDRTAQCPSKFYV
jgi:hypothetical protein